MSALVLELGLVGRGRIVVLGTMIGRALNTVGLLVDIDGCLLFKGARGWFVRAVRGARVNLGTVFGCRMLLLISGWFPVLFVKTRLLLPSEVRRCPKLLLALLLVLVVLYPPEVGTLVTTLLDDGMARDWRAKLGFGIFEGLTMDGSFLGRVSGTTDFLSTVSSFAMVAPSRLSI